LSLGLGYGNPIALPIQVELLGSTYLIRAKSVKIVSFCVLVSIQAVLSAHSAQEFITIQRLCPIGKITVLINFNILLLCDRLAVFVGQLPSPLQTLRVYHDGQHEHDNDE